MPRTFSRGQKWTAQSVFEVIEYLLPDEEVIFLREARLRYCTEAELEEQFLDEIFDLLFQIRQQVFRLITHNQVDHVSPDDRFNASYHNTFIAQVPEQIDRITLLLRGGGNV